MTDDETPIRGTRRTWTHEDDARLTEMRQGGHPDDIIGLMMSRTTMAIQTRVSKLKASGQGAAIPSLKRPSQWTPERVAEARAMRTDGLTVSQIAHRLGTDASTVGRALRSPETTEDSPGEGVRVGRTIPDLRRAESDLETARAVLARAQAKYNEALQPILTAVGRAVRMAGLASSSGGEGDSVQLLIGSLRSQGIELRVRP